MTALHGLFNAVLLDNDLDRLPGLSRYPRDRCIQNQADTFVLEETPKGLTNVLVFPMEHPVVSVDDRYITAETAHRLGQFQPHVAAADHNEMLGNHIQLERFDMRERLR